MISSYDDAAADCLSANSSDTSCLLMSCMALYSVGLADQPRNPQYPAFDLSHGALKAAKKAAEAAAPAVVKPKPAPAPPTETPEQLRDRVRASLLRRSA
jgi:hypothetical protein